jgi:pimeloyl-ACP methyl ester carboxylesterase
MTHGFGSASCHFAPIIPRLMKHYRIVLFDNLSFGMNPKNGQRLADITKPEMIDAWLVEFWEQWAKHCKLLPEKFFLAGHSFGGYQAALYASKNPERIEKAFFLSPACFCKFDPTNYDPYSMRNNDTPHIPRRWVVNRVLRTLNSERSLCSALDPLPAWYLRRLITRQARRSASPTFD